DDLCSEGLLSETDFAQSPLPGGRIDYETVSAYKARLDRIAWERFRGLPNLRPAFEEFCHSQTDWLDDYALFEVLRHRRGTTDFQTWPSELRHREPAAIARVRSECAADIDRVRFEQFLVSRQFIRLKEYAHSLGV